MAYKVVEKRKETFEKITKLSCGQISDQSVNVPSLCLEVGREEYRTTGWGSGLQRSRAHIPSAPSKFLHVGGPNFLIYKRLKIIIPASLAYFFFFFYVIY